MFCNIQGLYIAIQGDSPVNILRAGSIDKDDQNHSILTLFDLMTHTPQGSVFFFLNLPLTLFHYSQSRLGDHGMDGLKDFIASYSCSTICRSMQLSSLDTLSKTLDTIINDSD